MITPSPCQETANPEDAVTARQTLLDGLARDADIFQLVICGRVGGQAAAQVR